MKKVDLTKYTDFIVEKTVELLNIDSPTGYTTNAAKWVKESFEALGYEAKFTNKGGVLVNLGGKNKEDGLMLAAHTDTLGGMVATVKDNGRGIPVGMHPKAGIPAVEVHISDVDAREPFRQVSYAGLACEKTIKGQGLDGYRQAILCLADKYR